MKIKETKIKRIKSVEYYIYSLEEEMLKRLEDGSGFLITEKKGLKKVKVKEGDKTVRKNVRLENGIYSTKYGSIWGDDNAFKELFSCKCGNLQGNMWKGVRCHECGSKVEYKGKDLKKTGYLFLNDYYIMSSGMYNIISTVIGKTRLDKILNPKWETPKDGNPIRPVVDNYSNSPDKYDCIGMMEFKEHFEEILDYFYKKTKKKAAYDFVKANMDKVFTKAIPVISLILRPITLEEENFDYSKLNNYYSIMSSTVYSVNNNFHKDDENFDKKERVLLKKLHLIQRNFNDLNKDLIKTLNSKTGDIRNGLESIKANHCMRCVIRPLNNPGGKIDEVRMSYLCFLGLYKPEIINILCKLKGYTVNEAYMRWKFANRKFDKTIREVMLLIIKKSKPTIWLNRNPTLGFGSILQMRITDVDDDITNLTLQIPLNILAKLAGDFDGDTLNSLKQIDKQLKKAYRVFNPRNMTISRSYGLFDNDFNLIKDQILCLNEFCSQGKIEEVMMADADRFEEGNICDELDNTVRLVRRKKLKVKLSRRKKLRVKLSRRKEA